MEVNQKKIFVNTTFDLEVLKLVVKRNWYWCALIFVLFSVVGFLYLRYTKPVYESSVLIQINSENQGADILGVKDIGKDNSTAKEIELLRSELLFQKAIKDLPLQTSQYAKGEFLTEKRYKQGNLEIKPLLLKDSSLCSVPIYIQYNSTQNQIVLSFTHKGENHQYDVVPGQVITTDFFDIKLNINHVDLFKADALNTQLYFVFNNTETLSKQLISGLSVESVDQRARTVKVSYRSHSASLVSDIVTSLTQNFFEYDEDFKKESAENILDFIAVQLDSLTRELEISKDSVMYFKRHENISNPDHLVASITGKMERLREEEREVLE